MTKKGAAGMTLAFLLVPAGVGAASAAPAAPRIALTGSVMRGFSAPPGSASRTATYHVELDVTNIAAAPTTFDVAEAAWLTAAGKGLHVRNTRKGKVWRLEEGESALFEFDTDGYTGQLLHDANGGPLFIQFTLFLKGQVVANPFRALLPPLQTLPDYRAIKTAEQEGGAVTVLYLRFVPGRKIPLPTPRAPSSKSASVRGPSPSVAVLPRG